MPRSYSIILFTHISPELVGSGNEPSYQCGWYETIQMATSAYHLHHPIVSTHSFHPISLYPFSQLSSFLVIVLSRERDGIGATSGIMSIKRAITIRLLSSFLK